MQLNGRISNLELAEEPEKDDSDHNVTGQSADYLLKAVVPDMEYYEKFLLGKLTRIEGVTGVHSSFELRRVVQRTALPLEHIEP